MNYSRIYSSSLSFIDQNNPSTFWSRNYRNQNVSFTYRSCFFKFVRTNFDVILAKRIFLMGPPGSGRKETALALSEHFSWGCISIGDLLKKEVSKKSEFGKAITESLKHYRYGNYFSNESL